MISLSPLNMTTFNRVGSYASEKEHWIQYLASLPVQVDSEQITDNRKDFSIMLMDLLMHGDTESYGEPLEMILTAVGTLLRTQPKEYVLKGMDNALAAYAKVPLSYRLVLTVLIKTLSWLVIYQPCHADGTMKDKGVSYYFETLGAMAFIIWLWCRARDGKMDPPTGRESLLLMEVA